MSKILAYSAMEGQLIKNPLKPNRTDWIFSIMPFNRKYLYITLCNNDKVVIKYTAEIELPW